MHLLFLVNKLPYADKEGLLKNVDSDISYVFLADRLGRGKITEEEKDKVYKEVEWFKKNIISN